MTIKKFLKAEGGVAAIEFAFIFPIMMLLFFGLIDFTGYVTYNRKITAVAGTVADLVSQHRTNIIEDESSKGNDIKDYFKVAGMILKPYSESNVRINVFGFRKKDATTVEQKWAVTSGGSVTCSGTVSTAGMLDLMTGATANELVVVQTCMTYTPFLGSIVLGGVSHKTLGAASFKVEEIITQRPRSTSGLECFQTAVGGTKCPATI